MPVSSLDYSLVDSDMANPAIDQPKPATDYDSESYDEGSERSEVRSSGSIAENCSPLFSQSFNEKTGKTSRYFLWTRLLGLQDEDQESPQSRSSTALPIFGDENRRSVFDVGQGSSSEHDIFFVNDLPAHRDEAQVMLDVKRSFTVMSHYNSFCSGHSSYATILLSEEVEVMRKHLYWLIVRILRKYPCLNYYQGYHDVASVVLLVCSEVSDSSGDKAFRLLESLTVKHLRDFMIKDISLTINHLKCIPLIAESVDPEIFELMRQINTTYSSTEGAYFDYKFLPALSSILTLFSHDLTNLQQLIQIWDFTLRYGSVTVNAYIYVSILMHFKTEIFSTLGIDETHAIESVDLDLAHSLLTPVSLLSDISDQDITEILATADDLIKSYSVCDLPNADQTFGVWFKEYNSASVMLTTSNLYATESGTKSFDTDSLKDIIQEQELQQQRESQHETELLQAVFDQIDSLSTSMNSSFDEKESSRSSLMSSLMSVGSATSSLNHTLLNNSSKILKKIAAFDGGVPGGDNRPEKNFTRTIYKISLTIGFVGFLLHFLLKESNLRTLLSDRSRLSLQTSSREILACGKFLLLDLFNKLKWTLAESKEHGFVKDISDISQIGLGSMKRSMYMIGVFK